MFEHFWEQFRTSKTIQHALLFDLNVIYHGSNDVHSPIFLYIGISRIVRVDVPSYKFPGIFPATWQWYQATQSTEAEAYVNTLVSATEGTRRVEMTEQAVARESGLMWMSGEMLRDVQYLDIAIDHIYLLYIYIYICMHIPRSSTYA